MLSTLPFGSSVQGFVKHLAGGDSRQSYTQADFDKALLKYKAAHAGTFSKLVKAINTEDEGAARTALNLFGQRAIARALEVKSRTMVGKSEVWKEIAVDLRLPHGSPPRRFSMLVMRFCMAMFSLTQCCIVGISEHL
jgi:hypothetical protein